MWSKRIPRATVVGTARIKNFLISKKNTIMVLFLLSILDMADSIKGTLDSAPLYVIARAH